MVLLEQGLGDVDICTWVRTGDTPAGERQRMGRRPPHIVVTTPESLYVLLGSDSGRRMLATTRTVIVDEIHALAPNKRGSHLALSLERLARLCGDRLQRIGLSATQKRIGKGGIGDFQCQIADATVSGIYDHVSIRSHACGAYQPAAQQPINAVMMDEFLRMISTKRGRS